MEFGFFVLHIILLGGALLVEIAILAAIREAADRGKISNRACCVYVLLSAIVFAVLITLNTGGIPNGALCN